MRILLVTLTDILPYALTQVLNPANDYCAIVLDDEETAKKMLANVPPLRDKVRPVYELKDCMKKFYFDVLLFVSDDRTYSGELPKQFQTNGLSNSKFVHVYLTNGCNNSFLLKRSLKYFEQHTAEFEIFSTGISYTASDIDATKFKYKLFNLGRGGQDLYYDYQTAKFVFAQSARGGGGIKYALIGLAPYSFHYDESKSTFSNFRMLQYCVAFNNMHNFVFSADEYRKFFRNEFLSTTLPTDSLDLNNVYYVKSPRQMNVFDKMNMVNLSDTWTDKNYPDTKKENIKILDDYLTLCEKNNARPIMFLPPLSKGFVKCFDNLKLDEFYYLVSQAQRKHPAAVFFDGWKLNNFSYEDFSDGVHLNLNGAAKFSAILNNVIEQLER